MISYFASRLAHVTSFVKAEHTIAPADSHTALMVIAAEEGGRFLSDPTSRPLYPRVRGYGWLALLAWLLLYVLTLYEQD